LPALKWPTLIPRLNDPIEQEKRFLAQLETEEELPKKIDKDLLPAWNTPCPRYGIGHRHRPVW